MVTHAKDATQSPKVSAADWNAGHVVGPEGITFSDGSVQASASGIKYKDVQLTNAKILTLRARPIELVPVPGANMVIVPLWTWVVFDSAAGAYTANGGNPALSLTYMTGPYFSDPAIGWDIERGVVLPQDAGVHFQLNSLASYQLGSIPQTLDGLAPHVGEGLFIGNGGDVEFGGGNAANTLSIRIWYITVPTVPFGA